LKEKKHCEAFGILSLILTMTKEEKIGWRARRQFEEKPWEVL